MKWLNKIPLLRLLIPFILGIVLSFYFPQPSNIYWISITVFTWALLLFWVLFKSFHTSFKQRWIFGVLISTSMAVLGFTLSNTKIENFDPSHFSNAADTPQAFIGVIDSEPQPTAKSTKAVLQIKQIEISGTWQNARGQVMLYLQKDSSKTYHYGDEVLLNKAPIAVKPPTNFDAFDYQKYLKQRQIYHQVYLKSDEVNILGNHPTSKVKKMALKCRHFLKQRFQELGIHGQELDIVLALSLGDKSSLDNELKSAYASAGAMHVLAVSGLHVGIIILILQFLLSWMDRWKYGVYIKSILLILGIWAYAFITGLSPSVVRAATMFSFLLLARSFNRTSNIYNTLALSALVILLFEPWLLMDVGFQLSYLALTGIIYLHPHLYGLISVRTVLLDKAWSITCVSIAAQLATLPLALLYFHQFPTYFLLTNLIVIPSAFLILFLAIAVQALGFIPGIGSFLAFVLQQVVRTLNRLILNIESLPYSHVSNIEVTVIDTWLLYGLLATISIWLLGYSRRFLAYSLSLVLILTVMQTTKKWSQLNQQEITFYDTGKNISMEFTQGIQSLLIGDSILIEDQALLAYNILPHHRKQGIKHTQVKFTKPVHILRNTKVLILNSEWEISTSQIEQLAPEIIYVNTYKKLNWKQLKLPSASIIIIGKSCSKKVVQELKDFTELNNTTYYSIRENGAIKLKQNGKKKVLFASSQTPH